MTAPLSWRSPKTEVRKSRIQGKGLFARKKITQGEIVAVKGGYIFDASTWSNLEKELGPAEIQIAEDLFIAPRRSNERHGSMLYLNHSCEPNVGIQGQIVFVAMRSISKDEELTHDWATTDDLHHEMRCNCAAPTCRGTITGKDWQKPELQEKYKGWFAWHIQRKIDLAGR